MPRKLGRFSNSRLRPIRRAKERPGQRRHHPHQLLAKDPRRPDNHRNRCKRRQSRQRLQSRLHHVQNIFRVPRKLGRLRHRRQRLTRRRRKRPTQRRQQHHQIRGKRRNRRAQRVRVPAIPRQQLQRLNRRLHQVNDSPDRLREITHLRQYRLTKRIRLDEGNHHNPQRIRQLRHPVVEVIQPHPTELIQRVHRLNRRRDHVRNRRARVRKIPHLPQDNRTERVCLGEGNHHNPQRIRQLRHPVVEIIQPHAAELIQRVHRLNRRGDHVRNRRARLRKIPHLLQQKRPKRVRLNELDHHDPQRIRQLRHPVVEVIQSDTPERIQRQHRRDRRCHHVRNRPARLHEIAHQVQQPQAKRVDLHELRDDKPQPKRQLLHSPLETAEIDPAERIQFIQRLQQRLNRLGNGLHHLHKRPQLLQRLRP